MARRSIVDEIIHYSSPNYDPQKAHEYYLRTRELKGRRSTKGFSKKQKEAYAYAKSQVQATKQKKIESARASKTASIATVRTQTRAVRHEISEKLKAFNAKLSEQYSAKSENITENAHQKREAIAKKLAADIEAIPEIPKGLPKDQRDRLLAERAEKIQKLRGAAAAARVGLNEDVEGERVSERTSVNNKRATNNAAVAAKRTQVAADLKNVVAKYINAYKDAKAKIQSESEATLDKEHRNIKSKVR